MADSYIKNSLYKDNSGDYCINIDAKIYFEDKENYFLTAQLGQRWRTQPSNFTQGTERDQKWIRRIQSYVDKLLNTMNIRRSQLEFLTYTTEWHPWGNPEEFLPDIDEQEAGGAVGSYRNFHIEIVTDVKVLPRNKLPY